ncbi:insulin receptor substrate 1-B [Denticeps clupeoides]|uniref:Insulin receptor substrate 1 n=1 Tax=Denticeps clupeoides TaxID=299321 RepID=A0AAY4C772_9TELE|nr:insulin receptor substrate 1 [Denticeps clupeoides]
MASPTAEHGSFSDVRKVGYLRKPKSMHKRFFVLRLAGAGGPSRLEYYENEKKWRHRSVAPRRSIPLESCFNINKRADSKNKFLLALYTRDEYFAVAADSEQEQEAWYRALVDLHNRGKVHPAAAAGEDDYSEVSPGPAFKEVWQVILKAKGLGQAKNLIGIYRLCLTNKTISFVKLNSDAAAVVLQLMNVRRCGHSENFFFIEVGRSAVTGPGEFWMQVEDSVVAQNMHETILEAMKAMSEEFRPRSKSQSSSNCSNPISVPVRRHHHTNLPPSQVGLGRRSRAESVTATSPAGAGRHSHSFRVRASSDGEGTMSRPASVDGSPGSGARTQLRRHRAGGSVRLHPPLNHSRSIPMPSSCSPSAISPVSLSSSCTSGHGSTSEGLFPRRSSTSISGSPSDGGFISSDEYGSSPCDFRSSFHSVTPDSLGHTPPAQEEELNNYITMAKPAGDDGNSSNPHDRPTLLLDEPDAEKCFRKRTHSSGVSPPIVCHQKTPSQSSAASLDEYTVMIPACACNRSVPSLSSSTHSTFASLFPEEVQDGPAVEGQVADGAVGQKDDGYMPMSAGVAPVTSLTTAKVSKNPGLDNGDYMPMSPKSISLPQQIINPLHLSCRNVDSNGYMMMSPSGSCSPDGSARSSYGKIWTNSANAKLSGQSGDGKEPRCSDYMNMSPASCSNTSTPPDCLFNPLDEPLHRAPMYAYFSLPRSFKHAHRRQQHDQSPLRLSLGASGNPYAESSSSSASSDSLGGNGSQNNILQPTFRSTPASEGEVGPTRPVRLSLDIGKASTLPRMRESPFPPEPKSPGEYVNIEFTDKAVSSSLASLMSNNRANVPSSSSEYMNMQLGLGKPPKRPVVTPNPALVSSVVPSCEGLRHDYLSMQFGSTCAPLSRSPASRPNISALSEAPTSSGCVSGGSEGPDFGAVLMGSLSGISAFTLVASSAASIRNPGAKVIRADPQGRRRHSSETFASVSTKGAACPAAASACPAADEVKRHSSASFENVRFRPATQSVSLPTPPAPVPTAHTRKGLNYLDLDLAGWSVPSGMGATSEDVYASINFRVPQENREE